MEISHYLCGKIRNDMNILSKNVVDRYLFDEENVVWFSLSKDDAALKR